MGYTLNPSETLPYGMPSQFAPNNSGGIQNYSSGSIVTDANTVVAAIVPIGFTPRKVRIIGITGVPVQYEYMDMLPANDTLKTAGGAAGVPAITLDTTGLITVQDRQFILSAAAQAVSSTYVFEAWA